MPKPAMVEQNDPRAAAAADALMRQRRGAAGYQSTIMGGLDSSQAPTLAKSFLLGK